MTQEKNENWIIRNKNYIAAVIVIIIYGFIYYSINKDNKSNKESGNIEELYPEYSNLNNMKHIDIVSNKFMNIPSKQNNPETYGTVTNYYKRENCNIKKAYLYINATVFDNPLSTHDSICFGISDKCRRIVPDINSLPVPQNETSVKLYNLNDISFRKNGNKAEFSYDENLIPILNTTDNYSTFTTSVFLSSERRNRLINRVTIYYECDAKDNCTKDTENCGVIRYK